MAVKIVMPKLGLTMDSGTIVKWYKKEGEEVYQNEPLLQIETDKIVYDVEAPASGILRKILAREYTEIVVARVIAVIGEPNEDISNFLNEASSSLIDKNENQDKLADRKSETSEKQMDTEKKDSELSKHVLASPAVRKRRKKIEVESFYYVF